MTGRGDIEIDSAGANANGDASACSECAVTAASSAVAGTVTTRNATIIRAASVLVLALMGREVVLERIDRVLGKARPV